MDKTQLILELKKTLNLLKRKQIAQFKKDMAELNFTSMQGMVLGYIGHAQIEKQDIYQKDLEKEFSIRKSTVTELLDALEKRGFIERVSVETDARLKKIILTKQTLKKMDEVHNRKKEMSEQLFKGFTQEDSKNLLQILQKIQHNLEGE